jgi:UDP-N-acetylglucosamine 2-epimerase (non-hydrolysing)/GDP/UDP-N,N'-diacetylbacillosamine 2-epimerase (hydrolysing)
LSRDELRDELGVAVGGDSILVAYHPVTIARDTLRETDELFAALERLERPIVFCFPNADAGSRELAGRARAFCETRAGAKLFVNLNPVTYWSLLRSVGLMLGNSSSGIMETPALELPTVNVGLRQEGRERARNILDVGAERESIVAAVTRGLTPGFRDSLAGMPNPYGDGHAAERIVATLAGAPGEARLLRKRTLAAGNGPAATGSIANSPKK